ncbi:OLC1v1034954C2 [Oldenlandia corymbosa var. corymbosa]|uniref:OLC1v1034954C2 n=1 Tax=Oldenlandia corymbosa var. corymbosa TaxID=529605 RepID=A0AAV1CRS8_OLDCO|nr:OLC1v1034954C2 [Oldenlandia corymbosa var. corymbosa]
MADSAREQSVMAVIKSARPSFRNDHDKVVFAVHACFIASGFDLHATGQPAFADDILSSTSTEEVGIDGWNQFDDSYAFLYSKPDLSSKKVLVKCLPMDDKLFVDAVREGDSEEPAHLEINVGDYAAANGGNNNNYASMFKNFGKLVRCVDKEIVGKFSGCSTASSSSQKPSSESKGAVEGDSRQPNPLVPDVDDPYGVDPPFPGYVVPPIPGFGFDDRFPGPPAGAYPNRGELGQPGGMLIGPNDPRFHFGDPLVPRESQPRGIPPGARFDPYGPPGVPGFDPNRFTSGGLNWNPLAGVPGGLEIGHIQI